MYVPKLNSNSLDGYKKKVVRTIIVNLVINEDISVKILKNKDIMYKNINEMNNLASHD